MKKLENFEEVKVNIKSIWGGKEVQTSSTETKGNCKTLTSDTFEDTNGDGSWGSNESGIICLTTTCL